MSQVHPWPPTGYQAKRERAIRRERLELLRCLVRRQLDLLRVELRSAPTDLHAVWAVCEMMAAISELERLGTEARA